MELKGNLIHIGEIQTFPSGFQKREFVIETEEQYKQEILLELFSDKVDIIDAHRIGDPVEVGVNLRGKNYTNKQGEKKWINNLVAWKVTKPIAQQQMPTSSYQQNENPFASDDDDDLPF